MNIVKNRASIARGSVASTFPNGESVTADTSGSDLTLNDESKNHVGLEPYIEQAEDDLGAINEFSGNDNDSNYSFNQSVSGATFLVIVKDQKIEVKTVNNDSDYVKDNAEDKKNNTCEVDDFESLKGFAHEADLSITIKTIDKTIEDDMTLTGYTIIEGIVILKYASYRHI